MPANTWRSHWPIKPWAATLSLLPSLEEARRIDPEDLTLVVGAGVAAVLHGDGAKVTRYVKKARQLGAADVTGEGLAHTGMLVSVQVRNP